MHNKIHIHITREVIQILTKDFDNRYDNWFSLFLCGMNFAKKKKEAV